MAKSFDGLAERATTKKTQSKAARRAKELLGELLLGEVRKLAGKSQQEVAKTLGMKQPSLSRLEKQGDMQISTLRKIVRALGGELEVLCDFLGERSEWTNSSRCIADLGVRARFPMVPVQLERDF